MTRQIASSSPRRVRSGTCWRHVTPGSWSTVLRVTCGSSNADAPNGHGDLPFDFNQSGAAVRARTRVTAVFFRPPCIFHLTAFFEPTRLAVGPARDLPRRRHWLATGGTPPAREGTTPYRGPIGPPGAVQAVEKVGFMMEAWLLTRAPLRSRTPRRRPTTRPSATGSPSWPPVSRQPPGSCWS